MTICDTGVPAAGLGFSPIGAAVCKIFGEWGLCYFGQVTGIAPPIAVELVSTRLASACLTF